MKYFSILRKGLSSRALKSKIESRVESKIESKDKSGAAGPGPGSLPEICKLLIEVSLNLLSDKLFKTLKSLNFHIRLKKVIEKLENHDKLLASANLLDNTIDLYIDHSKISDDSYLQQIPHSILHEVGHLVFYSLIKDCKVDSELKQNIANFCEVSSKEGGVSLLSDNYIKHIYGKKLREAKRNEIKGIDIKFHENFAEVFRLVHIHKLELLLDKKTELIINPEILKAYESLCIFDRDGV